MSGGEFDVVFLKKCVFAVVYFGLGMSSRVGNGWLPVDGGLPSDCVCERTLGGGGEGVAGCLYSLQSTAFQTQH